MKVLAWILKNKPPSDSNEGLKVLEVLDKAVEASKIIDVNIETQYKI